MNKQLKKLTLNKETLRDLTLPSAGQVKGGATEGGGYCSWGCPTVAYCTFATCKCHGKTYNKKC